MVKPVRKELTRKPLGQLAVEHGLATEQQVLNALRVQYHARAVCGTSVSIGEIMLFKGYITAGELARLLRTSGDMHERATDRFEGTFFGDVAIELGLCAPREILSALNEQLADRQNGRKHRLIGQVLFDDGVLDTTAIEQVLARLVRKG